MRKKQELSNPNSCLNKAKDEEMVFVMLGRDEAAPAAIRAWCRKRVKLGKNNPDDLQILEAEECAFKMEVEQCEGQNPLDTVMVRYAQGTATQDDLEVMAAMSFTGWVANRKKKIALS